MESAGGREYLYSFVVASIRHRGPHLAHLTDGTWEDLILWASQRRLLGRDPLVRGMGILWDDPTQIPADARRYDVAIPIDPEDIELAEPPIMVQRTLPFDYMVVRHHGSYDELPKTYDAVLGTGLSYQGIALASAPILELYRNSPAEVSPDELVTDLHFPVIPL